MFKAKINRDYTDYYRFLQIIIDSPIYYFRKYKMSIRIWTEAVEKGRKNVSVGTQTVGIPESKKEALRRKAATLVSAHFVNDVYPHLYPGLLPVVLMPQLGFSIAAAGLISTVTALTTQFMQPFLGLWGRLRKCLLLGGCCR
jgi:hypothetical protein